MNNFLFSLILCGASFIAGYCHSMVYWYERAETGKLVEVNGSIYKLEKQDVKEKE